MKQFSYRELKDLPYREIKRITASEESFAVVADAKTGQRISRFLENESTFFRSDKSVGKRLRYLARGLVGLLLPNFVPIWNRALMDGFVVSAIEPLGHAYEIVFSKPNREERERKGE